MLERKEQTEPLIGLDLIRFGAAVAVMMFHLSYWVWVEAGSTAARFAGPVAASLHKLEFASWGWIGVEIFFVLSGFVIAFSAERASPWSFARSRFLRLYPAAGICATVSLAVVFAAGVEMDAAYSRWLRSVILSPAGPWLDGVYWTLGVELAFYASVFAILLVSRFQRMSGLFAVLASVSAAFWVSRFMGVSIHPRLGELLMLNHGCFFALGGYIWLWSRRSLKLRHWPFLAIAFVTAVWEIVATGMLRSPLAGAAPIWAPVLLWGASLVAIVLSVRANPLFQIHASRRVGMIARKLGLMTYPLYLLHTSVGGVAMRLEPWVGVWVLPLAVLSSLLVAFAVSELMEPPFRRLAAGLIDRAGRLLGRCLPWPIQRRLGLAVGAVGASSDVRMIGE